MELGIPRDLQANGVRCLDNWKVHGGYSITRVNKLPDELYLRQFNEHLLPDFPILPWKNSLRPDEKAKL